MMDRYTRSGRVMHSHISFQQQEKNMKKRPSENNEDVGVWVDPNKEGGSFGSENESA
jgi:hypothetical protein